MGRKRKKHDPAGGPEPRPQGQTPGKAKARPQDGTEAQPQPKPQPQAQSKPQPKPKARPQAQSKSKPEAQAQGQAPDRQSPKPKSKPQGQAQARPQAEPKATPKAKPTPKPAARILPMPPPRFKAKLEAKPEAPEPGAGPRSDDGRAAGKAARRADRRERHKGKPQPAAKGVDDAAVLRALRDANRPLRRADILRNLRAPREEKQNLRAVLSRLVYEGRIIRTKGGAFGLAESMSMVTGVLQVQRSGVGFVLPEDKRRKDIFVNPQSMGDAWHKDKVVVAVLPGSEKSRRPEGRVVRVLERGITSIPAAVVRKLGRDLYLCKPTDPRFPFNLMVSTTPSQSRPAPGEVLLARPGERLERGLYKAEAAEVLGREEDVAVQEKLVKAAHGVPGEFPPGCLAEAERLPAVPGKADFAGRKDLRKLPLVTIDGAKARDFDDAVCVVKEGRNTRLWVAIADVAHYVPPGSHLDVEARERGNSYYFPSSVEPMFPEKLSNGLCSLNPGVPRLCMVAEILFSPDARILAEDFYAAVMQSHARLTYDQVHRALEENDPAEQKNLEAQMPMLRQAEALARAINRMRVARGSLDFDLPEPEIHFNILGEAVDISPRPRTFAHQLIEEFMVAANESVARLLTDRGLPCVYRVHESPDPDKLRAALKLLERTPAGQALPPSRGGGDKAQGLTPKDVQDVLTAARGTDMEYLAGRLLLRTMMQAKYMTRNLGHYGLASECYCHFTSPIRRYADLLVHRALKAALTGGAPALPPPPKLADWCADISARERVAMEAEREILKRLTVIVLQGRVGESFTGVVSGLSDYGFWVELDQVLAEGMVRLSSLTDDYYAYVPERQEIWGRHTRRRFGLGMPVTVALSDVNLSRLEINLALQAG
jgi:ribonuclease R